MSTIRTVLVAALLALLTLTGCSSAEKPVSDGKSPAEVMEMAKKTLDDTSGVHFNLATSDLPDGVDGVKTADGIGNHQPAWQGSIAVIALGGTQLDVPVIAVGGKVYASLLGAGYAEVDPAQYRAPDPALLMDPDKGFSNLLVNTDGLEKGEEVRGGDGNDEVLTEYSGTVESDLVKSLIPTASGDPFDVTYTIASNGEVRTAVLTGQFYPGVSANTYTVDLSEYGTKKDIKAP